MEIRIRNNHFVLLHQKAIYWEETNTLIVADLHIGKITHFRKHGIAIPDTAIINNFDRLDEIIETWLPARILFLGDLFHHKYNYEWEVFTHWRKQHSAIEMMIIIGNHDILPEQLFRQNNILVSTEDYREEGFVFTHHPRTKWDINEYVFAGHLHPVYRIEAKARQSVRLPCFLFDEHQMILPSFGIFTGGHEISYLPNKNIFVIADRKVFSLT